MLVIVNAQHVRIVPYFSSAERRMTLLLQGNGLHLKLRQHVTSCRTGLHRQFTQVLADLQFLQVQLRFQHHFDRLRLAVRVSREIDDLRSRLTLRQVVFLILRHTRHIEAFHEVRSLLAVAVNHVIYRPFIAALEDRDMQNIRSDKQLLRYLHHFVLTVFVEYDDIVDIRAIKQILVLFQTRSYKALFAVDVQLLVVLHHCFHVDRTEVTHLRPSRIRLAVFRLQHLEPRDRVVRQMIQVLDASLDLLLQLFHQLIRFLGVELGDTQHLDLKQALDIFRPNLPDQLGLKRRQGLVHERNQLLLVRRVLVALLFIDTVLNENLL